MIRKVTGVVGGLIVWFIVATIGNLLFRISWPGYAGVEIAMTFTPAMMIARLLLGALSSLCAGCAVAWITKASSGAARILGALLTVLFIPVHYGLWDKFPVWYHLIFLASLFPFTLLGSYFSRRFLAVQQ